VVCAGWPAAGGCVRAAALVQLYYIVYYTVLDLGSYGCMYAKCVNELG
jgi:hypothetical protein